jgi:hypothetical protein
MSWICIFVVIIVLLFYCFLRHSLIAIAAILFHVPLGLEGVLFFSPFCLYSADQDTPALSW